VSHPPNEAIDLCSVFLVTNTIGYSQKLCATFSWQKLQNGDEKILSGGFSLIDAHLHSEPGNKVVVWILCQPTQL